MDIQDFVLTYILVSHLFGIPLIIYLFHENDRLSRSLRETRNEMKTTLKKLDEIINPKKGAKK